MWVSGYLVKDAEIFAHQGRSKKSTHIRFVKQLRDRRI